MSWVQQCTAQTPLQGDAELTKLIPRFKHPKFLPLSQVASSICRWVNTKERKPACTYQIPITAPCLQTRGGSIHVFEVFAQGISHESSEKFQHMPFHAAMACHTLTKGNFSHHQILYYCTFAGQAGGSETDSTSGTILCNWTSNWVNESPLKNATSTHCCTENVHCNIFLPFPFESSTSFYATKSEILTKCRDTLNCY